jgi:hypothetical protein
LEVAVPESVTRRLAPMTAVGSAIVCTSTPAGVYSSRKRAVAALVSAAAPVPTRETIRLPGVMGDWAAAAVASASAKTECGVQFMVVVLCECARTLGTGASRA